MDTADRIGLLPSFGWIAGHNFWVTLVICIAITPIGHLVVGMIGESRWVPISPSKQFLSFFPGDLFLAVSVAGMLSLASSIDAGAHWYNATWWHVLVLVGAIVVAILATYGEWKSGVYPTQAIFSPTKLYHNGLLYVGYGYVIVTTLVALLFGGGIEWLLALVLVPAVAWAVLVVLDSTLRPDQAKEKARHAHTENWEFLLSPF